jgi:hypothetical protein
LVWTLCGGDGDGHLLVVRVPVADLGQAALGEDVEPEVALVDQLRGQGVLDNVGGRQTSEAGRRRRRSFVVGRDDRGAAHRVVTLTSATKGVD